MRNLLLLVFLLTFLRFAETFASSYFITIYDIEKIVTKKSSENFGITKRRLWKDSYSYDHVLALSRQDPSG